MSTKAIATSPNENTKRVRLTNKEKSARQKEVDEYLSTIKMREWKADMIATDVYLPRTLEDIIDVLSQTAKNNLAKETLDKYNKKKEIRSRKP